MPNFLDGNLFNWSLALVVGVPLLVVVLTEWIERLQRRGQPLATPLRWTRNLVVPLLALVLVLRYLLGFEGSNFWLRLAISLLLLAAMIAVFRASSFGLTSRDEGPTWRHGLPTLYLQLPRFLFALLVIYLIFAQVWNMDVAGLITALGIGSLVIALALQETLSSLFSGLLLLMNRPFKEGEWIQVGSDSGIVWEVNWRNTTIRTRDNDLIVIPNGNVAKNALKNFSRPTEAHRLHEEFHFYVDHPPNRVMRILHDAALATPGVLAEPEPDPRTISYDGESVHYKIFLWVDDYGPVQRVRNAFVTSVYYHAQRHGLAWPRSEQRLFHYEGSTIEGGSTVTAAQRAEVLRTLPTFAAVPPEALDTLAEAARLLEYGQGEQIVREGEREQGLYVITSGEVSLQVDVGEEEREINQLQPGDLFGETGLFSRAISACHTTALTDVTLLRIPHDTVNSIINKHPHFAQEMSNLIEARKKLLRRNRPDPAIASPERQNPS